MRHLAGLAALGCALAATGACASGASAASGTPGAPAAPGALAAPGASAAHADSTASENAGVLTRDMFRTYASAAMAPPAGKSRNTGKPGNTAITKSGGSYYNTGRAVNSGNFSTVLRSRTSNNSSNSFNTANGAQRIIIHHRR